MKKLLKVSVLFLLLAAIFFSLVGCESGGTIPPIVTSYYTITIRSEDVSGWVIVDGVSEGYLYPASSLTLSLSYGSHTIKIGDISYPTIFVNQNNQEFWFNSSGNWY